MTRTYTRVMLTTIPDMFWDDYCLHAEQVEGEWKFSTQEPNRLGFTSAARWGQGHLNRLTLFFFLLRKMPPVIWMIHNLRDRRRELYVRN